MKTLDGILFTRMVNSGAANLKAHAVEINDLNVFPIPDGDTGDNMLMTIMGGVHHGSDVSASLSEVAEGVSSGMLLSARGNSGVILSQFFEGIKKGFSGLTSADVGEIGAAFKKGVEQAYASVATPTEGTILTVVREATEYACAEGADSPEGFLNSFVEEAKRSLARTPELLPVLKKAGVVDSGAAGLIYIVDGMMKAAFGEDVADSGMAIAGSEGEIDLDAFGEDSVLEFGYCTELLLRLQNAKTDISTFDVSTIRDYLATVGDSIVTVRNGSIVKLHVHTMRPQLVLDFCQRYGEFLKVKIENMSLQHNGTERGREPDAQEGEEDTASITESLMNNMASEQKERTGFGVVAVATGEGLKAVFRERGADVVVDGGQSMNPSAEDFIAAFDEANADVIFVYPNNGNIVLTAKQAAGLYHGSDVRVIESKSIGEGYASLSMYDDSCGDADAIEEELRMAMEGVLTVEISHCVRDANIDGVELHTGEYIGFVGKRLLAASDSRLETACRSVDGIGLGSRDVLIVIYGKGTPAAEAEELEAYVASTYPGKEIYLIEGGQDVYDYILVAE